MLAILRGRFKFNFEFNLANQLLIEVGGNGEDEDLGGADAAAPSFPLQRRGSDPARAR